MSFKPSNTYERFQKYEEQRDFDQNTQQRNFNQNAPRHDFDQNAPRRDFNQNVEQPEFDDSPYQEFESGKYMQARSLDIEDSNADDGNDFAERRSFDHGRALQYPAVNEYPPEVVDDAHQFTQVEDRSKFRAGHSRGNSRHHIHDSQHHDKQKHREEVKYSYYTFLIV